MAKSKPNSFEKRSTERSGLEAGAANKKARGSSKNVVFFYVLRFRVGHLQKILKNRASENCNGKQQQQQQNQDTNVAHLLLIFLWDFYTAVFLPQGGLSLRFEVFGFGSGRQLNELY